ncbi:hypothetical protein Tco_1567668 [Tanacetum coccineum]
MGDNRTMAELLQAPTEGYEDAIVIPEINTNFELKHGLINLVQNKTLQAKELNIYSLGSTVDIVVRPSNTKESMPYP